MGNLGFSLLVPVNVHIHGHIQEQTVRSKASVASRLLVVIQCSLYKGDILISIGIHIYVFHSNYFQI